jgi:hypothetical protein
MRVPTPRGGKRCAKWGAAAHVLMQPLLIWEEAATAHLLNRTDASRARVRSTRPEPRLRCGHTSLRWAVTGCRLLAGRNDRTAGSNYEASTAHSERLPAFLRACPEWAKRSMALYSRRHSLPGNSLAALPMRVDGIAKVMAAYCTTPVSPIPGTLHCRMVAVVALVEARPRHSFCTAGSCLWRGHRCAWWGHFVLPPANFGPCCAPMRRVKMKMWIEMRLLGRKSQQNAESPPMVSPEELKRRLDRGEDVVVLDVRQPEAYAECPGAIPGSIRIPPAEIPERYNELPRNRPIIPY